MHKYRLMRETDTNDFIEFNVDENDDPRSKALEVLGWTLVVAKINDDEPWIRIPSSLPPISFFAVNTTNYANEQK